MIRENTIIIFFDNYFATNIFFKKNYFIGDDNHIPNHIKYYIKRILG